MAAFLWNCDACHHPGRGMRPYESADGKCPECGRGLADAGAGEYGVRPIEAVHLLMKRTDGRLSIGGRRYVIACDPDGFRLPERATGDEGAVTCPKCLAECGKR